MFSCRIDHSELYVFHHVPWWKKKLLVRVLYAGSSMLSHLWDYNPMKLLTHLSQHLNKNKRLTFKLWESIWLKTTVNCSVDLKIWSPSVFDKNLLVFSLLPQFLPLENEGFFCGVYVSKIYCNTMIIHRNSD